MTTLDNPSNIPDPDNVPYKQTALKYGGIGGLISVVLGLIFYVTKLTDPTDPDNSFNTIANVLNYVVLVGTIVMAIKFHKENELGGYLKIGRAIGLGTLTGLVLGVIGAIWTILFFTVIDPGMLEGIREMAIEQAVEGGAPEEQVEGMIGMMVSPTSMSIMIIIGGALIGLVTGVIAGAIMKKDPPVFA